MQDSRNVLFCGNNLDVLRNAIGDEAVDLIYLDPPFNSNASYSATFGTPASGQPAARITAFDDAWRWDARAHDAFDQAVGSGNAAAGVMLRAMRSVLHENDMMAY